MTVATELVQQRGFLESFPAKKEVIKRADGESVVFRCTVDEELLKRHTDIIVEVWTNLHGRYHGYHMRRQKGSSSFRHEMELRDIGFFRATFRWRTESRNYWTWQVSPDEQDFSEIHVDPSYINRSIVYNAFIRFFGQKRLTKKGTIKYGDSGTFDDLKHRLKELKELGIDILYLNPIHPIGELYRNYNPHDQFPKYMQPGCPYSIKDYKAIDPEIGIDLDHCQGPHESLSDPMIEFKELVNAAHKLGIKVYMDLVFNHTSHDFVLQRLHPEWFLYKEDIKSLEAPYILPEEVKEGKPWGDQAHTMCPYDHGYWWEDAAQLNWEYRLPEGKNAPPKNPTISEMYAYFKSIPKYWIKHLGIDGFRCDVAYRIPTKFWRECIHEAREFAKREGSDNGTITGDAVFIAESYVDDVDELLKAGFSAVYGDYSNKLYNAASLKGYTDYMYNLSGKFFPDGSKFFIFPECHDFIRNTKKMLGHLSHDAIMSERANRSRWVLTATLPGIPMIFNGFEKLEWQPINLFSYSAIDWEADNALKEYIAKVNKIRKAHPALQEGSYHFVESNQGITEHSQLFSFFRRTEKETLLVVVNMDISNRADMVKLLLDQPSGIDFRKKYVIKDLMTGKQYVREGKELFIVLEPGESHIFLVKQ